jgi:hypothetical protein
MYLVNIALVSMRFLKRKVGLLGTNVFNLGHSSELMVKSDSYNKI